MVPALAECNQASRALRRLGMDKHRAKTLLDAAKKNPSPNVETLVKDQAESLGVAKHDVARHLYQFWRDGELKLVNPHPPSNLAQYAKSFYSLWFWALTLFIVLTGSAIYLLPQIQPYVYLRYVVGSLFILYLPGFALIEALYPKREGLESLERLALSIGLSLALVPLVGLVLNYTPWGIRLDPIFVSLAFLTIALGAVAVARKFTYLKMGIEAGVKT